MLKRFTKGLAITLSLILCFGSFEMQTQAAGISSIFPGSGISVVLSEGVEESGVEQVVSPKVAEPEEIEESEEEENPENLVISIAKDYINVRETAAQKGKVVGKFYKNAAGTILSEQDGWYEIESGNVTGFVKADLCATGEEALVLAEEVGTRMAKVKSERLLVREEADSEAAVIGMVVGEDELMVLEETDEWVKVDIEEGYGWVSREFVKVYTDFIRAETKEEEKERLAKERQESEEARTRAALKIIDTVEVTDENEMGIAVAEYAVQFIGNPYVWGGTSLTNGVDCSGFVMKVYEEFDVSLPHSSAADRKQGYAVNGLENALPGDLICYSGHVALYIGDGMIVHASNEKDGIKVSKAAYRKILAIRRIF